MDRVSDNLKVAMRTSSRGGLHVTAPHRRAALHQGAQIEAARQAAATEAAATAQERADKLHTEQAARQAEMDEVKGGLPR